MLELIKQELRITHDKLDSSIELAIASARAEMVRAGVPQSVAEDEDNVLITQAISAYCKYILTDDDKIQQKYFESFQYQLDNLRKSTWEVDNA